MRCVWARSVFLFVSRSGGRFGLPSEGSCLSVPLLSASIDELHEG